MGRRVAARRGVSALSVALLLGAMLGATPVLAAALVYVDDDGVCAGLSPCFTTVQEGVDNAGPPPAEVRVFPGTYAESVDLAQMGSAIAGSPGALTVRTVNASGTATPGTASIDSPAGQAIGGSIGAALTLIGLDLSSTDEASVYVSGTTIVLTDITSTEAHNGGIVIFASTAATLTRVSSTGASFLSGIDIQGGATAVVTVTDSSSDGNATGGWNINFPSGSDAVVTVDGSSGDGNADEGWNINHGDDGDVTITDSTGDGNGDDGWNVNFGGGGPVDIARVSAVGNAGTGLNVNFGAAGTVALADITADDNENNGLNVNFGDPGPVTLEDTSANGNAQQGINVNNASTADLLRIEATANEEDGIIVNATGAVSLADVTAVDNGEGGIEVSSDGETTATRITSSWNLGDGLQVFGGAAEVTDAWVQGNSDEGTGISLSSGSVAGSIVCEHVDGGDGVNGADTAEGVWWGSATGPMNALNPGGTGDIADVGDFTPWIDTIGASADAASSGEASDVRFTFSGGAEVLGAGPGDADGPAPFKVLTDNGTLVSDLGSGTWVYARIGAGGTLTVSLTPASNGSATITLDGPCGLDRTYEVDVAGAGGPTPTPTATPTPRPSLTMPPTEALTDGTGPAADGEPAAVTVGLGIMAVALALGLATRRRDGIRDRRR